MTQVTSARAQFRIRAAHEGTFTIGPPIGDERRQALQGDRVMLKVVAKGHATAAQQHNPFDPFGVFGRTTPLGTSTAPPAADDRAELPVDPKLNLERPVAPGTFLHAAVDKTHVVVGEQVTFSVYVYVDIRAVRSGASDPHEAGTRDFLRQSLPQGRLQLERMRVRQRRRQGCSGRPRAQVRALSSSLGRARDHADAPPRDAPGRAESEDLEVRVTEPPWSTGLRATRWVTSGRFTVKVDVRPGGRARRRRRGERGPRRRAGTCRRRSRCPRAQA